MYDEKLIMEAFRDFIYKETGWKITTLNGLYHGVTADRYKAFKAGYIRGLKV